MDIIPTKKKIAYSLLISLPVSVIFLTLFGRNNMNNINPAELMSPREFHMYYLAPILSFLITYFVLSWYIVRKGDESIKGLIKAAK